MLDIAEATEQIELQTMLEIDYFEVIDRHVIKSLIEAVTNQTIPRNDAKNTIRMRRNSHFFDQFYHVYGALSAASELLHEMSSINLGMEGFDDGINRYSNTWYKIDQYYRKFIHNYRKSAQPTLLNDLCTLIENKYVEITTSDPIPDHLLIKNKIKCINYISDDFESNFLEKVSNMGIKLVLLCSAKDKLQKQRFKFFDYKIHDFS